MNRWLASTLILSLAACLAGCAPSEDESLPNGLLFALSVFETGADGSSVTLPARAGILVHREGVWDYRSIEDADSNVFHKVMAYEPEAGAGGVLTLGGTRAIIKLWRRGADPEILWEEDFGGKFSRMRDAELADLYGDGSTVIAVATHDQGVVAVVRPDGSGGYTVEELDRQPNTIVHEIEVGDLDGDGVIEIYATPSAPNKLDGTPQPGEVVRYVPAKEEGRVVVAALGDRHAKEILVTDVDGDGRDELYASIEAVSGGQVEIRRYDAETDPESGGVIIAEIPDSLCRFLTAGDLDGDGRQEMVAAAHKSGLWLLRPGENPRELWSREAIDSDSSGFEHASILTDLDGDGTDELYVASDSHGEIRRYVWRDGQPEREVLYSHPGDFKGFTWNVMPIPVGLIP